MATPLGSQFDPHLFAEAARPQVSSHLFEDKLCRSDKGGLDLPVKQPTCCQFILSFVQHPSQSLLSGPDSTEALADTGEAGLVLILTVLWETMP